MKIKLLTIGKLKFEELVSLASLYQKRLRPFVSLEVIVLKECPVKKGFPAEIAAEHEAEEILEKIAAGSIVVALDAAGKQKTTEDFQELFTKWENEGRKEITFIIGGAYGLGESVLRAAHLKLALSKMTFTHEMAQVIFLEQLYRVYTLKNNIPYHH